MEVEEKGRNTAGGRGGGGGGGAFCTTRRASCNSCGAGTDISRKMNHSYTNETNTQW